VSAGKAGSTGRARKPKASHGAALTKLRKAHKVAVTQIGVLKGHAREAAATAAELARQHAAMAEELRKSAAQLAESNAQLTESNAELGSGTQADAESIPQTWYQRAIGAVQRYADRYAAAVRKA
jgi:hypothetical protein